MNTQSKLPLPKLRGRLAALGDPRGKATLELGLLTIFVLAVSSPMLDFEPHSWPLGMEFTVHVEGHHFWIDLKECLLEARPGAPPQEAQPPN